MSVVNLSLSIAACAALSVLAASPVLAAPSAQAATAPAAVSTAASSLTITFDVGSDPAHQTGQIMVVLYNSEAAYSGGAPVANAMIDVAKGQRTATFNGLAAGDYGFKAFHDLDGDGKMTTNPFGMPVEPYAFSNNARGNMGPAGWDRAHFTVSGATAQTISIH